MKPIITMYAAVLSCFPATAEVLKLVHVTAPEINCVFAPDCSVSGTDSVAHFALPLSAGTGFLQTRTWMGQPGTLAEGLHAYLYRVDLGSLLAVTTPDERTPNCVVRLAIPFGSVVPLDLDGDGSADDRVFVVAGGGIGSIGPTVAEQVGEMVWIEFLDPPLCPPDSSFFIGLVSTQPPRDVQVELFDMVTGSTTWVAARAPTAASDSEPVLRLRPANGYAGSDTLASGQIAPGASWVRLLWDDGTSTVPVAESPVDEGGQFLIPLKVPARALPGEAIVKVQAVGPGPGGMTEASFTVVPTPAGSLRGRLTDGANQTVPNALVRLMDPRGLPVAVTTTDGSGNFYFGDVAPGIYSLEPLANGMFFPPIVTKVPPGKEGFSDAVALPPSQWLAPAMITKVGAIALPLPGGPYFGPGPALISDQKSATQTGLMALLPALPAAAGPLPIRFWAEVQGNTSAPDLSVRFTVRDEQQNILWNVTKTVREPVFPGHPVFGFEAFTSSIPLADLNAHGLPPGELSITVTPFLGDQAGIGRAYFVRVVDLGNRWFNSWVVPTPDEGWERPVNVVNLPAGLTHRFRARLPNSSVLPFDLSFTVPVFNKTLENLLDVGVPDLYEIFRSRPWVGLRPGIVKPAFNAEVKLFSNQLFNQTHAYQPTYFQDGSLAGYKLPQFKALGPAKLLDVLLYQAGPGVGCINACFVGCQVCAGWSIYVDLTVTGEIDIESEIDSQLVLHGGILPKVNGTLGGHVRVKLVVCSADADVTGTVGVQFPFRYRSHPEAAFFDTPCVTLSGSAGIDIGCLGLGFGGGGSIGPYTLFGCTEGAAAAADIRPSSRHGMFQVDPAPAVAARGGGEAISVWIHDESDSPLVPQPFVYFNWYAGESWTPGEPLTPVAAFVNHPKVVSRPSGQAVAVWAQNRLSLERILETGGTDPALQEIYYAVWDGDGWTEPGSITHDEVADGLPSLAVSPVTGEVLAAWTRVLEGFPDQPDGIRIVNVHSSLGEDGWSEPQPLSLPDVSVDTAVSVRYDRSGAAWAAWSRDLDGDLTTFADRQIMLSQRGRLFWSEAETIPDLPQGAFSPSFALDANDQPLVVFLVPPSFAGEITSGFGNRSRLWFAHRRGEGWEVRPVGNDVFAEEPEVRIDASNQAIILFRRFSADGLLHRDGDVGAAVASLALPAVQWREDYLTFDGQTNWKLAFDLDPVTAENFVVNVKQSPLGSLLDPEAMATAPRLTGRNHRLQSSGTAGPAVAQMIVDSLPDLGIAGGLEFSDPHPAAGTTVTVTVHVANQGVGPVNPDNPFTVAFIDGSNAGSPPFVTRTVTAGLGLGETVSVSAPYQVPAIGLRVLTVVVDHGQDVAESDEANNVVTGLLGQMPAPASLVVVPDIDAAGLELEWDPPETSGLSHYGVWRSSDGGGTFEWIGATIEPVFLDYLVLPGISHVYAVTAHDTASVQSMPSPLVSAVFPIQVQAAAPELTARQVEGLFLLRWPKLAEGFRLQVAEELSRDQMTWDDFPVTPSILETEMQVIVPDLGRQRYFRLARLE